MERGKREESEERGRERGRRGEWEEKEGWKRGKRGEMQRRKGGEGGEREERGEERGKKERREGGIIQEWRICEEQISGSNPSQ